MPPSIISASRRTDIPAFFTPWLMRRIRAGEVMVRNPRNPQHVMRVSLRAEDVTAIVFWSRDYSRLLPHLLEIDDLGLKPCFHLTLCGYGPPLERHGPPVTSVLTQFEALAKRYGPSRIIWRYDPIVLGTFHSPAHHEDRFADLAKPIAPFARRCVISFLDLYPSTRRELQLVASDTRERFDPPDLMTRRLVAQRLREIGARFGLRLSACCEADVADVVDPARCIDPEMIREIAGRAGATEGAGAGAAISLRAAPTRKGCGCTYARDIGANHTCAHGCVYCYANESPTRAMSTAKLVEQEANHLGVGNLEPFTPPTRRSRRGLDQPTLPLGGRPGRTQR